MRLDRAPFDDNRVRVALKLAIDRPKAVKVAWLGFGAVANDVIGLGWPSYADKLPRRKYDPEKAKFLLKQAGHDDLEVTLVTGPILPGVVEASQVYAESAKRAGINIKLLQVSADEFWNTKLYYLKIPFGATWWPAVSFEEWASAQLISSARFNETVWKRPDWDARFRKAQALSDDNKRNTIYADLQREFWDEGGYIVYGLADFTGAAAAKVKGIVPRPGRPLGNNQFQNVWIG
jgi:peptide/nickel transport system substrate-binding protein